MELRILTADDVRRALPMVEAIAAVKQAFAQLSQGQAEVPLRSRLAVESRQSVVLFMPAYLKQTEDLAVKIVSVFPHNSTQGFPTIHALVVVVDPTTGRPAALLEGAALTAIRTGAASGAATDLLARPDATVAAIFGSGAQARTQLEAVCTVRTIRQVQVYGIDADSVRQFVSDMAGHGPIPHDVRPASTPAEAVEEADIVCTATTSSTPVFDGRLLRPGTHVNAIGSYTPAMQEVDAETLRRSLVVVDSRSAVLAESGDLMIPIQRGEFSPEGIHAELGEIVAGIRPGRTSTDQITFFKSVGNAVQDAAAARMALERAARSGLGRVVEI
ncbi:MAG: ornithine cyclodeaminase family protein [Chloroflexota bacterium]